MEKYVSGAMFYLIASVMQSAKYISAAVYMAGNASQSRELFQSGLKYVGAGPDIMAAIAVGVGSLLIVWGIVDSRKNR